MSRAVLAVTIALLVPLAACSSGDDSTADATTTSTSTTTTVPGDEAVRELIADRLTEELGDAQVASAVAAQLDPTLVSQLQLSVPDDEIATTPVLSYRPETTAEPVDTLVVLSFGNRVAADGTTTAGPTNEALADAVQAHVAQQPVPVYAQWEVAELLQARGVPNVVSIEPEAGADGATTYLSTSGVTDQIVQRAEADGVDLGTVGVVAFSDHVVRSGPDRASVRAWTPSWSRASTCPPSTTPSPVRNGPATGSPTSPSTCRAASPRSEAGQRISPWRTTSTRLVISTRATTIRARP